MAFLGNNAVNRINLHFGIEAFAQMGGTVFFLAFLLHAGVPIPVALASQAAIHVARFAIRPVVLPLARRIGLRRVVVIGALAMAPQYPLLAEVHGIGPALAILCVATAIGDVLYWPAYHAYFAAVGDAEHRGHQIAAREALVALIGIVAPLAVGWSLVTAGPRWTFAAVGLIQVLAALPLLGAPNVSVLDSAPGALRAARFGTLLQGLDGWFCACYYFVWQVGLFVALHRSLTAYGGAMAVAALVGAVSGLFLGRAIDLGHARRAVILAFAVTATVVGLRALSLGSPWLAVTANALGALVTALEVPVLMTATYNLAKASPCPLRFHIATEGGWDLGCFCGCLAAAALAAVGVSLSVAILLALPGILLTAVLLWRHYPQGLTARA